MRIADFAYWSPLGTRPALSGAGEPHVVHAADLPPGGIVPVPGFDIGAEVGTKGVRSMDRATAFAVATAGRLLDGGDPARTGVVLATTAGSFATMMAFQAQSLTKPKPYQVDPGRFPVAVMNYAAGQVAIRHGITGPNAVVRGGTAAGGQALRYARRLLASGRVDQVLCGATEEATAERAWLEHAASGGKRPIGEGSVMFRLVADDEPGPRITAIATQLGPSASEGALRRALASARTAPEAIRTVATTGGPEEAEALRAVLGALPETVAAHERLGDTSAAAMGFALAAVLETTGPGTHFALTGIERPGLACCIVGRT